MDEMTIKQITKMQREIEALKTRDHLIGDGARVYNSGNISITDSTLTDLTFDSERFDIGGYHSTSSNTGRLTVPYDGIYLITGNVDWAVNATGYRLTSIYLNNTTFVAVTQGPAAAGTAIRHVVTTIYQMSATDYVTLRVFQTSGGNLNVTASGNFSPEFSIWRVG